VTSSPEGACQLTSIHARRALAGDSASLEWLVDRLAPLLVAHANYRLGPMLRPHHDAEDLVQEAWLTVFRRLATLELDGSRAAPTLLKFLSTTITLSVQNLLRRHLRGGGKVRAGATDMLDELPAETSGVITRTIRRERRDAVTQAIDELPAADREVVLLRGVEQLPARTVATTLELSETAVAKRYERALGRLRAKLADSVLADLPD
jgi:RNA polymerase sigma factor (sigma-70 family)